MATARESLLVQLIVMMVAAQRHAAFDANQPAWDAQTACDIIWAALRLRISAKRVYHVAAAAGTPFRRQGVGRSVGLDLLVATFGANCGWNYGVRFVWHALRHAHPQRRISFHAVREAWRRLNVAAYAVRFTGAVRRLIRQGHFFAPHFCALWYARHVRKARQRRARARALRAAGQPGVRASANECTASD